MKAALCVLLLVVAVAFGAEEKKNEKRGVLGLGYGLAAPAPVLGHGLGLYGHGLGLAAPAPVISSGYYGHGLAAAAPVISSGYYGHGLAAAAPVLSHSVSYGAAPLALGGYHGLGGYGAPLLGLGHGYLH